MNALTEHLRAGRSLDNAQVRDASLELLDESSSVVERVAFLKALAEKGESPAEIAAFVSAFLEHAVRPPLDLSDLAGPSIDVCGTGGDKLDLFNVSTTSMFILAAGGAAVVKHGNRGITSTCGGADVLEALGIRIDLPPEKFAETVTKTGVGFMLAPQYHPAFKAVVPVRKVLAEQGVRTIFNLIGPLLNPVQPEFQLVGVFDPQLPPVYADILNRLGRKRAWAVHGVTDDGRGMDEVSTLGRTFVCEGDGSRVSQLEIDASELEFAVGATVQGLQGGAAKENAKILTAILSGEDKGPKRDIAVLNAAAAFVVTGLSPGIAEGIQRASEAVDSGAAAEKLRALQAVTGA
jgi:anthranilate phosphoribosyltransferase